MIHSAQHAASYYAASSAPHPDHAYLQGEHNADVCIIGGGYSGLNTAIELAERGFSVILLEARKLGWGASGRNGGQLIRGGLWSGAVPPGHRRRRRAHHETDGPGGRTDRARAG